MGTGWIRLSDQVFMWLNGRGGGGEGWSPKERPVSQTSGWLGFAGGGGGLVSYQAKATHMNHHFEGPNTYGCGNTLLMSLDPVLAHSLQL